MDEAPVPAADDEGEEGGDPVLVAAIRSEMAAAGGRLTFARFMELALYHPERGYYLAADRRPGRGGDFLTAPETHPFFGVTLARQIAECWDRLGRPDPWVIREYGAGVGGLAYDLIAGLSTEAPAAAAALRYRLVEPNRHRREQALAAMAEVGLGETVGGEELPPGAEAEPIVGVALANEVADALPVHRLVWRDGEGGGGGGTKGAAGGGRGLRERYVVWQGGPDGGFGEEEGDLSAAARTSDPEATLRAAGVGLADGDAIEVGPAAAAWFAGVGRGLGRGYAIVIDYGYGAAELYRGHRLGGMVRAYRRHTVTDDPFGHVGRQDLTAHVDFTALRRAGEGVGLTFAGFTTQGAFLASLGMGDLLVRLQADPETTAEEYLATQAAALRLIDPGGMGRFGVLIMARDAPVTPPLRAFAVAAPGF